MAVTGFSQATDLTADSEPTALPPTNKAEAGGQGASFLCTLSYAVLGRAAVLNPRDGRQRRVLLSAL